MGEIVGAALVSHIPPIVWPDDARLDLYGGIDTTLVAGLHTMRTDYLDRLDVDTVIVFDTHWYSTVEHIITSHDRRRGLFTSDELPRAMASVPYDMRGDPELAQQCEALATDRDDTWILACDEPELPVHYPTINLLPFLQRDEAWLSVGICQTATPADWLLFGKLLATAISELDRRVVLLASGGLSHKFWPLREFRQHETADPVNIITPDARAADEDVLARFGHGDHAGIIDGWADYRRHSPEGMFAHYLMMAGAIGGRDCAAQGTLLGNYESAAGTGQANVWFERPEKGWTT